jgi:hypothetical protein
MLRYYGAATVAPPGCRVAPGSLQPLPRGPARGEYGGNLQHQEREISVTLNDTSRQMMMLQLSHLQGVTWGGAFQIRTV